MRVAKIGAGRGVYVAPWMGPDGEIVLLAISRERRLVGEPFTVPIGGNHVAAGEALWERLDIADPIPDLKIV
jgi:hypothetical protein